MSYAFSPASQLSSQNPWPGLRAFTEADSAFFLGRERETAELLGLIRRAPVVVLYGQSGLGKTSLLQAGLFPELKKTGFLPFRLRFNHSDGALPLPEQLKQALTAELDRAGITGPRPSDNETLWEYFHRRDVDFWGPRNRLLVPVIVLDQFEEVFTLGQRDENASARVTQFASDLESVLEHRPPESVYQRLEAHPDEALNYDLRREDVKFVLSLREDFLAPLDTWRARMPSLLPNRFRLERMTAAQALDVVERGGRDLVEPGVARDIVDFVSSSHRRRVTRAMEQRDVEPALLSVVCEELNRSRIERHQAQITADVLSGERESIIQNFYERAFEGIDDRVRDWVEDELLTDSGYRDRSALEDALRRGLPASAFDQLVDRRILHREERDGVVWLELTHDLLTDPATQSRTVRRQRQQAEAAAQREAEYAHKLRRTRSLMAVFAVLLVVTAIALLHAWTVSTQLRKARAAADAEAQKAKAAAALAERSSAEATRNAEMASKAKTEAETNLHTAQNNFTTAMGATEDLGLNPVEQIASDMRAPTATILQVVHSTDESYRKLSANPHSPESVRLQHAHFLAKAADVLFHTGHINEGLSCAQRAVALLGKLEGNGVPRGLLLHAEAEAYYARGSGLLLAGQLSSAQADLENAAHFAAQVSTTKSKEKNAMDAVRVLSQVDLGEADGAAFKPASANPHIEQALNFIAANQLTGDESDSWRSLALRAKAMNQTEDTEALTLFTQAQEIAQQLVAREPDNLRWQRLSAELYYRQGFSAYRLSRNDQAANYFERARAGSNSLCERDPDNLDWCLVRVLALRGLELVYQARGEPGRARDLLPRVLNEAGAIHDKQPRWFEASLVRNVLLNDAGDLAKGSDPEKAMSLYARCQQASQELIDQAPEELLSYRLLGLSIQSQGDVRGDQNKDEESLKLYQDALQKLQPLEASAKDIPDVQADRAWDYVGIGNADRKLKRAQGALAAYDTAARIWNEEVKRDPRRPSPYRWLSVADSYSGDAYMEVKDMATAAARYDDAARAIRQALQIAPTNIDFIRQQEFMDGRISDLRFAQGDLPGSLEALEHAVSIVWTALRQDPANETLNNDLTIYRKRADRIQAAVQGDPKESGPSQKKLSPAQSQELLARVKTLLAKSTVSDLLDSQSSWDLRPLMAGAWRTLAPNEPDYGSTRQQLRKWKPELTSANILAVRKLPLPFWDDAALYESEIVQADGRRGVISFLRCGTETVLLDGTSAPIHKLREKYPPQLDTPESAAAYLRFFVGAIQSDDGRFLVLDQPEDIRWSPEASAKLRRDTAEKVGPLVIEKASDSGWQAVGTLEYSTALFVARFRLHRDGLVDIAQDKPFASDLPVLAESFVDGVRTIQSLDETQLAIALAKLKAHPDDGTTLQELPHLQAKLKQWKKAISAEQRWISFVEHNEKDAAKRRQSLLGGYLGLSWYQLFARDFSGALASCEAGLKLDSSYFHIDINRAHALMFLGRNQEAEALYLRHRGQKIGNNPGIPWEKQVLEDFADLEKAGLTSPEMARVRQLFQSGQESNKPGGAGSR